MEKYREAKEFMLKVCKTCMAEDPKRTAIYRDNFNMRIDGLLQLAYFDKELKPVDWDEIRGWILHDEDKQ